MSVCTGLFWWADLGTLLPTKAKRRFVSVYVAVYMGLVVSVALSVLL